LLAEPDTHKHKRVSFCGNAVVVDHEQRRVVQVPEEDQEHHSAYVRPPSPVPRGQLGRNDSLVDDDDDEDDADISVPCPAPNEFRCGTKVPWEEGTSSDKVELVVPSSPGNASTSSSSSGNAVAGVNADERSPPRKNKRKRNNKALDQNAGKSPSKIPALDAETEKMGEPDRGTEKLVQPSPPRVHPAKTTVPANVPRADHKAPASTDVVSREREKKPGEVTVDEIVTWHEYGQIKEKTGKISNHQITGEAKFCCFG
jgi:hypothetical protein